jgi:hypothetical protein
MSISKTIITLIIKTNTSLKDVSPKRLENKK